MDPRSNAFAEHLDKILIALDYYDYADQSLSGIANNLRSGNFEITDSESNLIQKSLYSYSEICHPSERDLYQLLTVLFDEYGRNLDSRIDELSKMLDT